MERMITRKDAAAYLGISIATLDATRLNGQISYVQYVPNGCIYFTTTSLQEFIAKCTHRAKPVDKCNTTLFFPFFQKTDRLFSEK